MAHILLSRSTSRSIVLAQHTVSPLKAKWVTTIHICMIENIHMKQSTAGGDTSTEISDHNDEYIDVQLKNRLNELLDRASNFGTELVIAKLAITLASVQIAYNIRIDYHTDKAEQYFCLTKHNAESHAQLIKPAKSMIVRGCKR